MIIYRRVGVYQLNICYFMHRYHPITGTRNDASTAQASLIPEKKNVQKVRSALVHDVLIHRYISVRKNTITDQTQKDYVTEKIYSKQTNELSQLSPVHWVVESKLFQKKATVADEYLCAEKIRCNGIILSSSWTAKTINRTKSYNTIYVYFPHKFTDPLQ